MKVYAANLIHDLRERRLLPVALLLIAAIVAVPVLLLKPSSAATDGASAPAVATETATAVTAKLLEPGESQPSDLDAFASKDPFARPPSAKPLKATAETSATAASDAAASDGAGSDAKPGGGDAPSAAPSPAPEPTPETPAPEQRSFAYALDLTFVGQKGERHYRNLQRLRMLPSTASPLLVFLGIEDGGGRATFLVDATVKLLEGEGSCMPSRSACATLSLEPGEQQAFADDQDRRYAIQVDQIRERELAKAAAAGPRAGIARPSGVSRRFAMPSLVDVVSEVQP
jgi:hypothetical protein